MPHTGQVRRIGTALLVGLLTGLGALAGCTGTASPTPPASRPVGSATGSPTGATTPAPSAASGVVTGQPKPSSRPATASATTPVSTQGRPVASATTITLAFAGDVHFERHVAGLLGRRDSLVELQPLLGSADVAVVNLETAITDRGVPQPKDYHFRTTPEALQVLAAAGVDAVSMANNHAVDYGPDGLADSLAAQRSAPLKVIGIGPTADAAFAPAVFDVRRTSVAVIAATEVNDLTATRYPATDSRPGVAAALDRARLVAAVLAARAAYDVVVVFLHWGTERTTCPDARQLGTAAALEQVGADVIVGGHQHRVLGAGWLGKAYVGYGLGNFVWWLNSRTPADRASGVLTVGIDVAAVQARRSVPRDQWSGLATVARSATLSPLTISFEDGVPRPAQDESARLAGFEQARACTRLRSSP